MDNGIFSEFLTDASVKLTDDDYKNKIMDYLRVILSKNFPGNPKKQIIKNYPGRINFCCPLCGDSANDVNKRRGNIITRGKFAGFYKCHNCGTAMSVVKFLKKCGIDSIDKKLISYVDNEISSYANNPYNQTISTADALFYVDEIDELCVPRDVIKNALHLLECDGSDGNNYGAKYLHSRLQYNHQKFLYNESMDQLYILNLTPSGKVFGFQRRELNKQRADKYGKYKTYSLSKIYTDVLKIEIPEDISELISEYNETSMIFNILCVDYNKPIFVTEGPMDAILLGNCIALCGGSKRFNQGIEDLYYIYDSDKDGVKYAINALNEGKNVFMWRKYLNDNGIEMRSKWDINDLFLYYSNKRMNIPNIMPYFTNDPMSSFDL